MHNEDNPLLGEYVLSIIKERIGRAASTVLKNSSLDSSCEQLIGGNLNVFDWKCANGVKDVSSLHAFIADIYKELSNKGNNPLFLSVGALKWTAPVGNSDGKPLVKEVLTPLLIFPIKLGGISYVKRPHNTQHSIIVLEKKKDIQGIV